MEWHPLLLSVEIALLATLFATAIGMTLAALLANVRFPGREMVDVVVTAPMVLPPTVLGYYLFVVIGIHSPIGEAWKAIFGATIVFTKTGCVIAAAIGALPFVVKFGRAALQSVDVTLVHAARTLGAGPLRAFFTVQLPLATRGVVAALMLGFARALGDFGATLMVGGNVPGETHTASLAIFDAVQAHRERDATLISLALTVIAVIFLYSANKLTAVRR